MNVKHYFYIQKLSFKLCGIDTDATQPALMLRRPWLCYVPCVCAILHVAAMVHYAYTNRHDFAEVTESLALSCQSLLAIWKMFIFLGKRRQFIKMIGDIKSINFRAGRLEVPLIVSENIKDVKICTVYFRTVLLSAIFAFTNPINEAIYYYCKSGELVLRPPFKATYFWDYSALPGYSLVYLWNILSIYNLFGISMAIDTLFTWLVSNISAQFHILCFRFNEAAQSCSRTIKRHGNDPEKSSLELIRSCIEHHNQTLELAAKLNHVYGEIIFIKFVISCSQICCLVFRLSRPSESLASALYQCLFLASVALQLMLYCYNGQRIRDESLQVAPEIYFAFDWSHLTKSFKKLLLLPMMRSQKSTQVKGVFFVVDLSLFLWTFKTAGSLIAALKTLEENQN